MAKEKIIAERNRNATEKKLLDTIGQIITEAGFEKVGINAIASLSGVSKILIYRYFGSVEGLMTAYIRQHDFWINFPLEIPARELLPAFLKETFRKEIERLRDNPILKRLYRWELSSNNEMIIKLREQREKIGLNLVEQVSRLSGYPQKEIAAMAAIISSSITYLVMLEEHCSVYNGIEINTSTGWEQIYEGIEILINKVFSEE
ncbi:TetR/AcrR family transcriptional regulator [Parabacteroides distasonis]|uniref:TetR/AcrR family transcriptional regulator n=1 Tax=Parabacteroides distasonis TaxID=823 RepID=UPI0034B2E9BA